MIIKSYISEHNKEVNSGSFRCEWQYLEYITPTVSSSHAQQLWYRTIYLGQVVSFSADCLATVLSVFLKFANKSGSNSSPSLKSKQVCSEPIGVTISQGTIQPRKSH